MAINSKNLPLILIIICFLYKALADSNQIKIDNKFKIYPSHYSEMLKTIVTDVETSEDSGTVNGTFYIHSVLFLIYFESFI